MDGTRKNLHNSRMSSLHPRARAGRRAAAHASVPRPTPAPPPPPSRGADLTPAPPPAAGIPSYALYGEVPPQALLEPLHCESIPARSRLHGWEIRPHRHEAFFQILYVRGGTGEARVEGESHAIAAPCILTLPALSVHGFRFSEDIDGMVITVAEQHVRGLLAASPEATAALAAPHFLDLRQEPALAAFLDPLFLHFSAEFAHGGAWRSAVVQALLTAILVHLARLASAAGQRSGSAPQARQDAHLRRFVTLVNQHYKAHWPLERFAQAMGVTASQLNRVCRAALGKSALAVVHGRLLLEAERDLAYTQLPVKQIALDLGFADAAYFTRFFMRHRGVAPTAFRASALGRHAARTRTRTV